MKNKIEEQTAVILAQDLRDQEQKAAIAAIQENLETLMGEPRSPVTAFSSSAIKNLLGGFRIPKSEM